MRHAWVYLAVVLALVGVSFSGCYDEASDADPQIVAAPEQRLDAVDQTNAFTSVIVKYKTGKAAIQQEIAGRLARFGAVKFKKFSNSDQFAIVTFDRGTFSVAELSARIASDADIEYVEPNYIMRAFALPNDPLYPYQWDLAQLNMPAAWEITRGAAEVKVAVIDTGVAYDLDDFAETRFDLQNDRDFVDNDDDAYDQNGHGTHCAGTIAQSTNNNLGTAGMAPDITLLPLRVLDRTGLGQLSDIADAIVWAADHGARIINLSLGGGGSSTTMKNALQYAYEKGVTTFAATGNNGLWIVSYPAAYDDYVIAVGASTYNKEKAPYSQYGRSLDVLAPGGDTRTDLNNDGYADGILQETIAGFNGEETDYTPVYALYQGTSMACPHAVGLGALLQSRNPNATPDQIRAAIQNTAEDLGTQGWDSRTGHGLINPVAALAYIGQPGACQAWSATVDQHVTAGRAYAETSGGCDSTTTYYATGSDQHLGTSADETITLKTTDGGKTYTIGACAL